MPKRNQPLSREELEQKIKIESVRLLYQQAPASLVMGLMLAMFVTLSVADKLSSSTAWGWWGVLSSIALIDFLGYIIYRYKADQVRHCDFWYKVFTGSVVVVGLSWGLGILYLVERLPEQEQFFLSGVLLAIAGAAVSSFSGRVLPLCIFVIAVLSPLMLWLLAAQEGIHRYLGAFVFFYGAALLIGGKKISAQIQQTLRLQFENEGLALSLKNSNTKLQTLNQELTQLSATDPLTKVANRRYFEERLDKEWRRLSREYGELSVIMVDIDHFKAYNDNLGHQAGDSCLSKVALCIRDSLRRPADMVARYGGEEFIVLLPNTTKEGAVRVGEIIRENIIHLEVEHPQSSTHRFVTASVGVSHCNVSDRVTRKQLIARADEALYQSKDEGRNQVKYKALV